MCVCQKIYEKDFDHFRICTIGQDFVYKEIFFVNFSEGA